MPRKVVRIDTPPVSPGPPSMSPEDQENEMISMAMDLALQRLRDGSASNQLLVSIIKNGFARERLEKEKLQKENELLMAKVEAIKSERRTEELYLKALEAMRTYTGTSVADEEDDIYDSQVY